ncbi:MAG: NUDIX hydrolase [Paracoccus sp. (in: a-proteobacteria)]|uniref:NUDIX hydrolase n=1 Tax=Paracoccus sp. TaxID=267 RepID=UPI0039E65FBC
MIGRARDRIARMLRRRPPAMQVAALCRDARTGEVLLVTSRDTGRWILPKGWPMPGRSLAEAAGQEAWEEAGARGPIAQAEIGSYHYDKHQDGGFVIPVQVKVYPLTVESLAEKYPEAKQRRRRWYPPTRAAELVAETGLKELLRGLPARPTSPERPD